MQIKDFIFSVVGFFALAVFGISHVSKLNVNKLQCFQCSAICNSLYFFLHGLLLCSCE